MSAAAAVRTFNIWLIVLASVVTKCQGFTTGPPSIIFTTSRVTPLLRQPQKWSSTTRTTPPPPPPLHMRNNRNTQDEADVEEEARLRIWESRRGQIRSLLKNAESLRNYRIKNGTYTSVLFIKCDSCRIWKGAACLILCLENAPLTHKLGVRTLLLF
jgi:hypothetical protein